MKKQGVLLQLLSLKMKDPIVKIVEEAQVAKEAKAAEEVKAAI